MVQRVPAVMTVEQLAAATTVLTTGNQTIAGTKTFSAAPAVPTQPTVTTYSAVRLNTANGYGSSSTAIRRFTNTVVNTGTDITYADNATLGATFTINTAGVYTISFSDCFSAAAWVGISLNSANLATAITNIPVGEVLAMSIGTNTTASGASCSWVGFLAAGSVIRAHTSGTSTSGTQTTSTHFSIARVA